MIFVKTQALKPYYKTPLGQAYLGNSLEFLPNISSESVDLILTSPPFALKRKKQYGNEDEDKYVDWFMEFASHFHRILKPDGSFVLDLGGAYKPGYPVRSIYQFELLVKLVKEAGFSSPKNFTTTILQDFLLRLNGLMSGVYV